MLPLVYTHVGYALVFGVTFLACSIAEILGPAGRRERRRGAADRDRGSLRLLNTSALVGSILFFLFPLWVPVTTITWNQPLLFGIGFLVLFLGMSLRWYSMHALGRFFVGAVVIQAEHTLVQQGPYRYVRHPAYSGILIGAVGTSLMMENWGSLLILVVSLLVSLLYRMKVEEDALRQIIPEYNEYIQRTYRLIPLIF